MSYSDPSSQGSRREGKGDGRREEMNGGDKTVSVLSFNKCQGTVEAGASACWVLSGELWLGSLCGVLRKGWSRVAGTQMSTTKVHGLLGPQSNNPCKDFLVSPLPQLLHNP